MFAPRIFVCLLIAVAATSAAAQTTIRVPADKSTIQAAIDAAVNGDTVLVSPGTYYENIDFKGKSIVLTSTDGADSTVIDGRGIDGVVKIKNVPGTAAVLNGFTIQNGYSSFAGGVTIDHSSPTISNNNIQNNSSCVDGAGISSVVGYPTIRNNRIRYNRGQGCSSPGGAVTIRWGAAQILDNDISYNTYATGFYYGGGIRIDSTESSLIRNNLIAGNFVPYGYGGGIAITGGGVSQIVQNVIYDNYAKQGAGIYIRVYPSANPGLLLLNNTIANNHAPDANSGIYIDGDYSQAELINNLIIAKPGQVALNCIGSFAFLTFSHNDVYSLGGTSFLACPDPNGVSGNLSIDPLLDPFNYRLRKNSPVIDRGEGANPALPATDKLGNPRTVDGDKDGLAAIDIGAYEYAVSTLTFSTNPVDFGTVWTGAYSQRSVNITNTGSNYLMFSEEAISLPDFQPPYSCYLPYGLAPGGQCWLYLSFAPTRAGQINGQFTFHANVDEELVSLQLTGLGRTAVTFTPTAANFGTQTLGTTSPAQVVSVLNSNTAPLNIAAIVVNGDFSQANDCPAQLAVGASCNLAIAFTPTLRGTRTGSVQVLDNAVGSPHTLPLSGVGIGPAALLLPINLIFGYQLEGTVSSPQIVNVSNPGETSLNISSITTSPDFLQANDCGSILPAGASCQVAVRFSPVGHGTRSGALTINDNAPGSPHTVPLSGDAGYPSIYWAKTNLAFGNHLVGTTSPARSILIGNMGWAPLTISNVTVTTRFFQTNNCTAVLQPGETCTVSLSFSPLSAGTISGFLTITSDTMFGPNMALPISGVGVTSYPLASISEMTTIPAGNPTTNVAISGSNFYPGSIVRLDGADRATTFLSDEQLQFILDASEATEMVPHNVTIVNPSPGGGESLPTPLIVYRSIATQAKQLEYDSFSRRIFVTVGSTDQANPDSLVSVDPSTAAIDAAIPIGTGPDRLTLSTSGKTAFVGFGGGKQVRKVNIPALTSLFAFPLANDSAQIWSTDQLFEMHMVPGSESAIVASMKTPNAGSFANRGIGMYDDGVPRRCWVGNYQYSSDTIGGFALSATGDHVFASSNSQGVYNGFGDWRPSANGLCDGGTYAGLLTPGNYHIRWAGNLVYSGSGEVVDPEIDRLVGRFTPRPNLTYYGRVEPLPVPEVGKTFFLTHGTEIDYIIYYGDYLGVFNNATHNSLTSMRLPSSLADASSLVRWGTDGLAFRATINGTSQIILFRTSLLRPTGNTNVPITLSSISPQTIVTGSSNTVLTLTGSGFVNGMRFLLNGEEKTTVFVDANTLQAYLPAVDLSVADIVPVSIAPADSDIALATSTVTISGPNVGTSLPAGGSLMLALPAGRRSALSQQTIENATAVPLPVGEIAMQGDDFTAEPDCPAVLGAGESCDITLSFAPRAAGPRHGQLSVQLGRQTNVFPVVATGFDMFFSLERSKRPSRSVDPSGTAAMEAFASLTVDGIAMSKVRFGCVGAPAGTSCEVVSADSSPTHSDIRISLRRTGRLVATGSHTVNVTATVGDYTQTLPVRISLPATAPTLLSKPQRLSKGR